MSTQIAWNDIYYAAGYIVPNTISLKRWIRAKISFLNFLET